MLSRRLAPARIPSTRPLRPPNPTTPPHQPPHPRPFSRQTPLLLVARTARPQLPYLAQPAFRATNGGLLGPNPHLARLLSTETRQYVASQVYLAAKWTAIIWTFAFLAGVAYIGVQAELEERRAPTPEEWTWWSRWRLMGIRPLPEYYQKTPKVTVTVNSPEKEEAASRTPSAKTDMQALVVKTKTTTKERPSKQNITSTHTKAQIGIPAIGNAIDARMLTQPMTKYDVPPLAVYHICRICLRPRSNRYHREHPIPVNGVPPPPGICRRCRVKKVEESGVVEEDVVEIVKIRDERPGCPNLFQGGESNEMRIGLSALIPDSDIVSADEASERRDREVLRKLERGERLYKVQEVHKESSADEEETRRIRYRHVYVRERSVSANPQEAAGDVDGAPLPKPKTSASSTAQDAIDAVSLLCQEPVMTNATAAAASMEVQPTGTQQALTSAEAPPTIKLRGADTVKAKTGKEASNKASSSTSYPASRSETKAPVKVMESSQPRFTEIDIRRMAREEVVKFRHAERKLEAHPDAYAHGRLIPVARRIEKSRDVKEPRPWEEVEVRVVNQSQSGQKVSSQAAEAGLFEREVSYKHVSQPSQRLTADNPAVEPTSIKERPSSDARSQPQHSHTGRRDFAYEADSHTYSASRGSKGESRRASERSASQHEPLYRHPGAEGSIHKGRGELSEYERVSRTGTKSNKSSQTLQETQQSFRGDSSGLKMTEPNTGSSSKPLPPESDPPISVKMREVLSWDPTQRFEAGDPWQEPPSKHDVDEVIEEVEQPRLNRSRTDSRVSDRVRELKNDADREQRATSVRTSGYSGSSYLDGNSVAKTASRQTSRFAEDAQVMDHEDFGGGSAREPANDFSTQSQKSEARASFRNREEVEDDKTLWPGSSSLRSGPDQGEADEKTARSQVSHAASRQSGNESPTSIESRPRAFDRRMAAVRQQEARSREVAASTSEMPTQPGTQQIRDSQPLRDDEYIWARRVIRPVNHDEERVSHDDLPAKHRTYVDQFFRKSFAPIGNGPTRKDGRPSDHWMEVEERLESGKPAHKRDSPNQQHTSVAWAKDGDSRTSKKSVRQASPPEVQPSRGQQQRRHYRRETKGSPSSTSTRVRFASKVEVSPTPPGSDASSSQFRIIGARGGSKKRVDGESGEDLIAEYESRGRTRVRRDRRHHEPIEEEAEYYSDKKRSATPDAPRGKDAMNRWDGVDDSQYRPRKGRPLHTALSESPSRERLTETFGGTAKTIELAGAYEHREPWHATVESIQREGSGKW
ncbi:hypothetical protein Tdes44962_MAKER09216 [Teratosphaeria destructans]|uniref:Uncharacterized protein n=1 Tax=Teratosphaeria destructans TaxID=418781 RepID=A0A9W7W360_9PEZI|nr:hypothetical protein Tdes44962_MAKER09216 [Teratosphaeria destructans]